jgi:outer membrane immunogenic protein
MAGDLSGPVGYAPSYAPVIAPNWTGFYLGVNGGYGWDANQSARTYDEPTILFGSPVLPDDSRTSNGIDRSGGFGGGQIGYNWQFPGGFKDAGSNWVIGVEADIQGAGIDGSSSANGTWNVSPNTYVAPYYDKGSIDWFGTLRARLGYAYGPALFYVTGGLAFGEVRETVSFPGLTYIVGSLSRSNVDTGYTVGGGIEYKFGGAWSVKLEYQYIDLGTYHLSASATDPSGIASESIRSNSISDSINTVRVGINYHLNNVYVPLK